MATVITGNTKIFNNFNSCSSSSSIKNYVPINSLSFRTCSYIHCFKSTRLSATYGSKKASEHLLRVPMISCVVEDCSETHPEDASSDSSKEAAINLKLPRRSLLVNFTCDTCGVRSQRLINRLAYERGTVYIQCSGCSQYHQFVDNLGLVVEYDYRNEISVDPDADQH